MSNRNMSVNGQFYPDNKNEISQYITHFQEMAKQHKFNLKCDFKPKAIIVPHAGYIYSGFSANIAYETVFNTIKPKRVVVIGPSHKFGFDGASIGLYDRYKTPLGDLTIDLDFANDLYKQFDCLDFIDEVHCEHSTETQMPFIKHYFPDTKIVEIIYSNTNFQEVEKVIENILSNEDTLLVVSTDLSHFYNLEKATHLDKICLDAIGSLDIKKFDNGCEACGIIGVKAIVNYASKQNYKVKFGDYRTSADVTQDKQSVVGYTSFVFGV